MDQQKQLSPSASAARIESRAAFSSRPVALGGLVLIAIATWVAYYPALHGKFVWNDRDYVTKPELRSLNGLARIWFDVGATEQYYPLLHSFFWVQSQLWGDRPLAYHLVDLALHISAVWLLYLILRKLAIPGALLAAGIFALHPVMAESVAWITEQKNTLSTVFYLSALLVYLHFDQSRRKRQYAVALALYALAILSKTVTATLPAALLVIFWWQRGSLSWRRDVKPLLPWFALGIAGGVFTAWVEFKYIGAQGESFGMNWVQRLLIASRVPWFYLGKLLWPVNLVFMYPRWEVNAAVWWQWLFVLASALVLVVLALLSVRWRGPLAAWLLFIGTLFPVLGFLNVYWFVFSFAADHLQYLASLAIIVLAASGLAMAIDRLPSGPRYLGYLGCLALLAALGALTWRQAEMYSDVVNLYQTTIDKNPNCWLAYNNLGMEFVAEGQEQKAIACYEQALRLKPQLAEAHYNLANTLMDIGWLNDALKHYRQAIEIRPGYPEALNNLGIALASTGELEEAIKFCRRATELRPDYIEAYANLAIAYSKLGDQSKAIHSAQKALQLANASGQKALAKQIEAWLTDYVGSSIKGATRSP